MEKFACDSAVLPQKKLNIIIEFISGKKIIFARVTKESGIISTYPPYLVKARTKAIELKLPRYYIYNINPESDVTAIT